MNEIRIDRMVRELEGPPPEESSPQSGLPLSEGSWTLWALVLAVLFLASCV
jgi:hypothetical protein